MARKIRFCYPIESVSGKFVPKDVTAGGGTPDQPGLIPDQTIFISNRRENEWGYKLYPSFKTKNPSPALSSAQSVWRQKFTLIAQRVRAAYTDVDVIMSYRTAWQASGRKETLRKFIWRNISQQIENELNNNGNQQNNNGN